jgi:hypothetical protein
MYSPNNPPSKQLKLGLPPKNPLRLFPRPKSKTQFKPSPSSKYISNARDSSSKAHAKCHKKVAEKGVLEKKQTFYGSEGGLKKNFQLEMQEFVENRELEANKACVESKMGILMNLMQCIGPYEDLESISFDFLQGFLQVGDSFFPFIF